MSPSQALNAHREVIRQRPPPVTRAIDTSHLPSFEKLPRIETEECQWLTLGVICVEPRDLRWLNSISP